MIPLETLQLAHIAVEGLKNHWTLAAPFADAALWEAGKSFYVLLKQRFAGSPASHVLEEAAEDPANQGKIDALEQQIGMAMKSDSGLNADIIRLVESLPPRTLMTVSQTGDKNVSVQNIGQSNKTSIRTS